MLLQLLAFLHRLTIYGQSVWNATKQKIREKIGPQPQAFYLLSDGQVIPSTVNISHTFQANTYVYNPDNYRITLAFSETEPNARFRRLPYIAGNIQHEGIGTIDISDWLGELRAHPIPDLHIKQLIVLWSLVHNQYVPFTNGLQVTITKNDGETDCVIFE
jgi:hypothetical protein